MVIQFINAISHTGISSISGRLSTGGHTSEHICLFNVNPIPNQSSSYEMVTYTVQYLFRGKTPWILVHKRIIPSARRTLVSEVSANFCREGCCIVGTALSDDL
jgi:hypothetical protein